LRFQHTKTQKIIGTAFNFRVKNRRYLRGTRAVGAPNHRQQMYKPLRNFVLRS